MVYRHRRDRGILPEPHQGHETKTWQRDEITSTGVDEPVVHIQWLECPAIANPTDGRLQVRLVAKVALNLPVAGDQPAAMDPLALEEDAVHTG